MGSFFKELKNRNVYKAATAYVVTGWLVMQVVDTMSNNLGWHPEIAYWITNILIVGFPITLVVTWIYEVTPQGLKRTGSVQEDTPENRRSGKRLNHLIIGVLAIAICFMLVERVFFAGNIGINKRQEASIAVLPFANMSSKEENEFFADGLADQILDELANLSELKVSARTSSFMFKDRNEDVRKIGEELDVNYVLEGSVQYDHKSNRIKVTTQLINASNGYHLWSETYEEEFDEVFAIQKDISRKVSQQLRIRLLPGEEQVLDERKTENTEAYVLYLKSRSYSKKRNDDDLRIAIDLLQKAVELDPDFAEAYAELSFLYGQLHYYGNLPKEERDEKMKSYADKAIKLSPGKPEVLRANAHLHLRLYPTRDTSLVISDLRRAIELKPNYSDAYYLLSSALYLANQVSASTRAMERALELDPLNTFFARMLAQRYFYTYNEKEKALDLIDKALTLEFDPGVASVKAFFLMSSPYGDNVEAFKLVHSALQKENYDVLLLSHIVIYALNLDLKPVAEQYLDLFQMVAPDNMLLFSRSLEVNAFSGDYSANLKLLEIWSQKKQLDPNTKTKKIIQTYIDAQEYNVAESHFKDSYRDLYQLLSEASDYQSLSINGTNWDLIESYLKIIIGQGKRDKATPLAEKICEFYDLIRSQDGINEDRAARLRLNCLYLSIDIPNLVAQMDSLYFIRKQRMIGMFSGIKSGDYRIALQEPQFIEFWQRVKAETHTMRAEVIEYLKEEGDWNPAWDAELGID